MRVNRITVCAVLALFIMNFHLVPALYPLTVEEEAGKKKTETRRIQKDDDGISDDVEVLGKTMERSQPQARGDRKDPRLACLLSLIVPGGGHIYLRKDLKGIGFCVATGAGYTVTGYYLYRSFVQKIGPDFQSKVIVSALLFFISAIVHVVGIVEAYADAEEMNKRSSYSTLDLHRDPYTAKIVVEQ